MSSRDLKNEIDAAKILRSQIADLVKDDPDFLAEAIEGETSLFEQIDALVISVRADEAMAEGIRDLIDRLKARKDGMEKRSELKRALIASALDIAGVKSRETAAGTVSLKPTLPKVVIVEEADIPSEFFKPQDPTLDRKAIGERLKARQKAIEAALEIKDEDERKAARVKAEQDFPAIAGATLSNGSITIAIRG